MAVFHFPSKSLHNVHIVASLFFCIPVTNAFLWTSVGPDGIQLLRREVSFKFGVDKEQDHRQNKLHFFLSKIEQILYK